MAVVGLLRVGLLGVLAAAGVLLPAGVAGATQIGSAPCPSPRSLPGTQLTLCSTGSYVDEAGQSNLLAFVRNDGPVLDTPQMTVAITRADGTSATQTAYSPLTGLAHGDSTPIDAQVSGTVTGFQVTSLSGATPQFAPEDAFTFTGVDVATSSSSATLVSGNVVNDTGRTVIGIKVGYVAFTTGGAIAYYAPDIQQGPHLTIPAGDSKPFTTYRRAVPADAVISADAPFLFAQGNEPGAALPTPAVAVASGRSPVPVKRTTPGSTVPKGHAVVGNAAPIAGVRAPSAADLAGAAHPGTVVPSHDAKPVRLAGGANPALIDASPAAAKTGPGLIRTAGPLVLLVLLALLAARMLGRDAAAAREARSDRRRRRAAVGAGETLAPDYAPPVSRRR